MQFQSTNMSLFNMYWVHLSLPELYRQCCADLNQRNTVYTVLVNIDVLDICGAMIFVPWNCNEISSNVMWTIRNEAEKHLSELNKLTVWYVASVSGFMGWYVALLIKDCGCFCCSSKITHTKGKFFFGQFPR